MVRASHNPLHATLVAADVLSGHYNVNGSEIFSEEMSKKTVSTENIANRKFCNQSLNSINLLELKLPEVNSSK